VFFLRHEQAPTTCRDRQPACHAGHSRRADQGLPGRLPKKRACWPSLRSRHKKVWFARFQGRVRLRADLAGADPRLGARRHPLKEERAGPAGKRSRGPPTRRC
jgi:hypothetical protein